MFDKKEWYKQNKDSVIKRSLVNKARMKQDIRERLGNKCGVCRSDRKLRFHHLSFRY